MIVPPPGGIGANKTIKKPKAERKSRKKAPAAG